MSLIYRIKLTSTNYPLTPLYKVYYDGNTNNIPTISNTGQPANNLSYSQLIGEGIQVVVPDGTSSISLTHVDCGTTVSVPISSSNTYTYYEGLVYSGEPCSASTLIYDIYEGSDGKYYADQGGTYVLASSISGLWYQYSYMYNDGLQDRYVYNLYTATNGNFVLSITQGKSTCAPFFINN